MDFKTSLFDSWPAKNTNNFELCFPVFTDDGVDPATQTPAQKEGERTAFKKKIFVTDVFDGQDWRGFSKDTFNKEIEPAQGQPAYTVENVFNKSRGVVTQWSDRGVDKVTNRSIYCLGHSPDFAKLFREKEIARNISFAILMDGLETGACQNATQNTEFLQEKASNVSEIQFCDMNNEKDASSENKPLGRCVKEVEVPGSAQAALAFPSPPVMYWARSAACQIESCTICELADKQDCARCDVLTYPGNGTQVPFQELRLEDNSSVCLPPGYQCNVKDCQVCNIQGTGFSPTKCQLGKCKRGFKVFNNSEPTNLCLTDWIVDMVKTANANLTEAKGQEMKLGREISTAQQEYSDAVEKNKTLTGRFHKFIFVWFGSFLVLAVVIWFFKAKYKEYGEHDPEF